MNTLTKNASSEKHQSSSVKNFNTSQDKKQLNQKHFEEIVNGSGVDETIARRNFSSHGNGNTLNQLMNMKRYRGDAGFWVEGINPLTGSKAGWGQYKPDKTDPQKPKLKYKSPYDKPAQIMFLDATGFVDWQEVINTPVAVMITEGAKKAGCALTHRIPCVSIAGVWNGQKDNLLRPELAELCKVPRHFELCFDSDFTTNPDVCRALLRQGKLLLEAGCTVSVVVLPPEADGTKNGLDDFVVRHGIDEFQERRESALSYDVWAADVEDNPHKSGYKQDIQKLAAMTDADERDVFTAYINKQYNVGFPKIEAAVSRVVNGGTSKSKGFRTVKEYLSEVTPVGQFVIGDMLRVGETALLAALPGIGKSLFTYEMVRCVLTGDDFLAHPVRKGKAMIIQVDEPDANAKPRMTAFGLDEHGDNCLHNSEFNIADIDSLAKTLDEFRPTIVMMDSLRAITGGSGVSEDTQQMGDLVAKIVKVIAKYDASCVFLHHNNKNKDARGQARISGHTSIVGAVSQAWVLENENPALSRDENKLLTFVKQRDGDHEDMHLTLTKPDDYEYRWTVNEFDPMPVDASLGSRCQHVLKQVKGWAALDLIVERVGASKDTIRKTLDRMWTKNNQVLKRQNPVNKKVTEYCLPEFDEEKVEWLSGVALGTIPLSKMSALPKKESETLTTTTLQNPDTIRTQADTIRTTKIHSNAETLTPTTLQQSGQKRGIEEKVNPLTPLLPQTLTPTTLQQSGQGESTESTHATFETTMPETPSQPVLQLSGQHNQNPRHFNKEGLSDVSEKLMFDIGDVVKRKDSTLGEYAPTFTVVRGPSKKNKGHYIVEWKGSMCSQESAFRPEQLELA